MRAISRLGAFATTILVSSILASGVVAQSLPWHEPLDAQPDRTTIVVGDHELDVELAVTPQQQTLGLGYRNELPEGNGMLFVNDSAQPRSFWMKGMRFCLDIIWIDQGEIIGAAQSVCPDPPGTADADRPSYPSQGAAECVLEVPAGWMEEHGFGPGTPVEIPDWVFDLV